MAPQPVPSAQQMQRKKNGCRLRAVPLYHITAQQHVYSLQQLQPTAELEAGWLYIIKMATRCSHTCRSFAQALKPACVAAQDQKARPTAAHASSRSMFFSPQTQHATAILIRHSEVRAASSISSPLDASVVEPSFLETGVRTCPLLPDFIETTQGAAKK